MWQCEVHAQTRALADKFVFDALKHGKYEKAIKAGLITHDKAKTIVKDYKTRAAETASRRPVGPKRLLYDKVAKDLLAAARNSRYIDDPNDPEDVRQIILNDDAIFSLYQPQDGSPAPWWSDMALYDEILPRVKRLVVANPV